MRKNPGVDAHSRDLFRSRRASRVVARSPSTPPVDESFVLLFPVEKVSGRDHILAPLHSRPHHHQLVWIRIWQRGHQHRIHHPIDRRLRPNPQHQRRNHRRRQPGLLRNICGGYTENSPSQFACVTSTLMWRQPPLACPRGRRGGPSSAARPLSPGCLHAHCQSLRATHAEKIWFNSAPEMCPAPHLSEPQIPCPFPNTLHICELRS